MKYINEYVGKFVLITSENGEDYNGIITSEGRRADNIFFSGVDRKGVLKIVKAEDLKDYVVESVELTRLNQQNEKGNEEVLKDYAQTKSKDNQNEGDYNHRETVSFFIGIEK